MGKNSVKKKGIVSVISKLLTTVHLKNRGVRRKKKREGIRGRGGVVAASKLQQGKRLIKWAARGREDETIKGEKN